MPARNTADRLMVVSSLGWKLPACFWRLGVLAAWGVLATPLGACGHSEDVDRTRPEPADARDTLNDGGVARTEIAPDANSSALTDSDGAVPDHRADDDRHDADHDDVPGADDDSTGTCAPPATRFVRLSFHQQLNAVEALLGAELASELRTVLGLSPERTFPPLISPREGTAVSEGLWATSDQIAERAAKFVFDEFATVTGCGQAADRSCAESFVSTFAERAYRMPLDTETHASLMQAFGEVVDIGGDLQQAVQYGVHAVLDSPLFLYRTEFGPPGSAVGEVQLTPYELASALSFFLTDGPPDPLLLSAASRQELSTREQIGAQVDRLLASEAGRDHVERALFEYLGAPILQHIVIDPAVEPAFDEQLRAAMSQEVTAFLKMHLWDHSIGDLLTTRRTRVNGVLAAHYGLPEVDATATDSNGFAPATLPVDRAGLLTLSGLLTARSRPDSTSVVGRGLWIRNALICGETIPFPELLQETVVEASLPLAEATEQEKAAMRAAEPACADCHTRIDPYGLALESFDLTGRTRTVDDTGRAIDTTVLLPAEVGGGVVTGAVELAEAIKDSGRFQRCLTEGLMAYAWTEPVDAARCPQPTALIDASVSTDATLVEVLREIAVSRALSARTKEE